MGVPYPGRIYGTARDTINELLHAISIGNLHRELVSVPLSPKPVSYMSLDTLFDN